MASELTERTYRAAYGRWKEILGTLGIPAAALTGKHSPCPMCGGKDRFRFTDNRHEGNYICNQCGAGKGMRLLMGVTGWDFKKAAQEVDAVCGTRPSTNRVQIRTAASASIFDLRRLWESGIIPDENSLADLYFRWRGIAVQQFPKSLRLVPTLKHGPSKQTLPCLIAQFCDADGKPKQIHRTYLTDEGRKAEVEPPRMFMPGPLPKGGAIRLSAPAEVMGVAEGIETALAAGLIHNKPVWATTSAAMLKEWKPPPNAKSIFVFGDNDDNFVGQFAAYELAKRLVVEGLRVDVMLPPLRGSDWNDVLMELMNNARPA